MVAAGDQEGFKKAFGNMYVRSLKTGGEFCVVARITSVSEEHQNKLTTSLHGEYNGLTAAGSFKAAFETAMKETSSKTEVIVFTCQAGGVGAQASFTGPDAAKILERLSQFPQSAHDHPVGYEAELATYDTIPLPVPAPEEHEDRNIVLADCLSQKMGFLKKLSDLQFALGPSGPLFFEDLPQASELVAIEKQYRDALNGLMAHAIKVATGNMRPPQLYTASPVPPPITFKKKPVSSDDKANFANRGVAIANTDSLVAAFRELQPVGTRRQGFDIGMGVTEGNTAWGPGKQKLLDSLAFDEQTGYRQASTFAMIRNRNAALAAAGANIADADGEVETARKAEASGLYWLGFDIGTGVFGDPARGALGNTAVGPGSGEIRSSLTTLENVLLISHQAESAVLIRHAHDQRLNVLRLPRSSGTRFLLPSYFCAIRRRCQASSVSGVTIVPNSTSAFRPSPFALAANRRHWSSVKRSRLPPNCSRRTRFSSRK